jgi:PBP1b-binding outer membrane lipoprotein LpoB
MTKFRILVLVLVFLSFVLVGCATNNKNPLPDDKYGPKCNHPSQNLFKITRKEFKEYSGEKKRVLWTNSYNGI